MFDIQMLSTHSDLLRQGAFFWSVVLIVGYPIAMLALSEVILRLKRSRPLLSQTLRAVRNLVLPALAVFILLAYVLELGEAQFAVRVVQTLLWIGLIHVALLFLNALLFSGARARAAQTQVPKLLRDLVRFFLVLVGAALVLSTVWGADLGGLAAALGVSSLVVGLALQDALGNLFSGLAILIEKPFAVGDWIAAEGAMGKIVEINWRAVHMVTREQELIIVPNSVLSNEMVRNYRRPTQLHVEPIDLGFSYDDPPNFVKQILKETALGTPGVLQEPEPVIQTISYDDSSIGYRVRLYLADYEQVPKVRDAFNSRVWYAAKRNSLNIPFPIRTLHHQPMRLPTLDDLIAERVRKLRAVPMFLSLSTDDLETLARHAELRTFGVGEPILRSGLEQVQFHLLLRGSVEVLAPMPDGIFKPIAEILEGNFFGESALTPRQSSNARIMAKEDVEVLVLETAPFQLVLERNQQLLSAIAQVMDARQNMARSLNHTPYNHR